MIFIFNNNNNHQWLMYYYYPWLTNKYNNEQIDNNNNNRFVKLGSSKINVIKYLNKNSKIIFACYKKNLNFFLFLQTT